MKYPLRVLESLAATTWSMSWRSATGNASMATVATSKAPKAATIIPR